MIAAWILYATAFGILIAAASVLAEHFADRNDWATRRVWGMGLAAAVVMPAFAVLLKDAPAAVELDGVLQAVSPTAMVVAEGVDLLAVLDGSLLSLWIVASLALGALLGCGLLRTWMKRRRWEPTVVDGVPVLLADDVGPAVIGFLRSAIVLPRWALEAGERERAMMLRHEQEHLRVGDPRLILYSALLVVLMPWNLALWFMAHRLRLAIEVDCDRRVMRGQDMDTRSYAELLFAVGQRRSVGAYGVGFSLGRPFLEERIHRITLPAVAARRSTNLLMAVGVFGVLCAAWALPQPVRAAVAEIELGGSCPNETTEMNQTLLTGLRWET